MAKCTACGKEIAEDVIEQKILEGEKSNDLESPALEDMSQTGCICKECQKKQRNV